MRQVVEDGLGTAVVDEDKALVPSLPSYSNHESLGGGLQVAGVQRGNLGSPQAATVAKGNDRQVPSTLEGPVNAGLHKSPDIVR